MDINFTLIGQMITFLCFIAFTMKFIWPPLVKAMHERQKKIADGLAAAEQGKRAMELAHEKAAAVLTDTRKEAAHIIDQAGGRAAQIVDDAKARGQEEGARMIENAQRDFDVQVEQTREGLRKELIDLIMLGAERVLDKEMNEQAHKKLLDDLITSI